AEHINYDFPTNGGQNLYVQFADASKAHKSSVLTIQSTVDIFDDTTGIVLGDGSGLLTSRIADVHVSVPRAATKMRFATTAGGFSDSWQVAAVVSEFVFPIQSPDLGSQIPPTAGRQVVLYAQFSDDHGNISNTYNATATINLFPESPVGVLRIENDASTT